MEKMTCLNFSNFCFKIMKLLKKKKKDTVYNPNWLRALTAVFLVETEEKLRFPSFLEHLQGFHFLI